MNRGLLLVAHGSRDPQAAPVAQEAATAVGARVPGLVTSAAFIELSAPSPSEALDRLGRQGVDDVVVQPFLLSHAYHSKVDLPAIADLVRERGWAARLSAVLGPDDLLVDALVRRLRESSPEGDPYDGIVLAAAGSTDPEANESVRRLAEALGRRSGTPVVAGFASAEEPEVGPAVGRVRALGARTVAVATYLLAPGFFADRVRLDGLAAGAAGVTEPLGACTEVVDLVLRRAGFS